MEGLKREKRVDLKLEYMGGWGRLNKAYLWKYLMTCQKHKEVGNHSDEAQGDLEERFIGIEIWSWKKSSYNLPLSTGRMSLKSSMGEGASDRLEELKETKL